MKPRARSLRKAMSETQNRLWYYLRDRRLNNYKFVKEFVIYPFIVDFVCRKHKLIIEVDGEQHADAIDYDLARSAYLGQLGYKVFRVWNIDVIGNIDGVLEKILMLLEGEGEEE
jgi:very-short-patch-repair endonuclease